jgi:hypothetical protein
MISSAMIKGVWAYRGFITSSVKREFQSKYRNSLLGAAWTILNPLAMIVVYTVVFAQVMRNRLPGNDSTFSYSIYLCAGVLTWGLFAEIVGRGQGVFLEHANLIKKINFPRICLPIIVVLSAGLNFAIIFGLFTGFLVVSGNFPGAVFLALIAVIAIRVFPRCRPVFHHPAAILVLVHAYRLSGFRPARESARADAAQSDGIAGHGLSGHPGQPSMAAMGNTGAHGNACRRLVRHGPAAVPCARR